MLGGATKSAFPQYTPPKLERAFVFNPRFGPKEENADEKLLYYFPASASNTVKYSDIGLSEALSNVTRYVFIRISRKFFRAAPRRLYFPVTMREIFDCTLFLEITYCIYLVKFSSFGKISPE